MYILLIILFLETYEKGIEKLVTAQDTSNVENNEISSDELRERKKQKRRINAKKNISLFSSDEEDKENRQIQNKKQLSFFPKLQDFVSKNKIIGNIAQDMSKDMSHEGTSINKMNSNGK